MTPEVRLAIEQLNTEVERIRKSEDLIFIENAIRGLRAISAQNVASGSSNISKSVNEAGTGSYSVAKVPDATALVTINGQNYYIGLYNT